MRKWKWEFLILLFLFFLTVVGSADSINFNTCTILDKSLRDECLLSLSQKLEQEIPSKTNKGHFGSQITFHDGMWTNTNNLSNVDQNFHASLTPEINYTLDHGQIFSASWTAWNQASISSAEAPPETYYGRPLLFAFFPLIHRTNEWKLGGGIRPPAGSGPRAQMVFQSPIPLDRVWEISIVTAGNVHLSRSWSVVGASGVYYNTEYDYKDTTTTNDESVFDQWPILSKSSVKIQKDLGDIQLGLGFIGQYGFGGREIVGGNPNYSGNGNEVLDFPDISYNAAQFSFGANLGAKFNVAIDFWYAISAPQDQQARFYANPDDPSLSSNLFTSVSLSKVF